MAIIIEEERSKTNLVSLLGWSAIVIILLVATYYIFFAAPDLVNIAPPANFQNITPLAQISLAPEEVLTSPAFQALEPPSFPLPTPQGPAAVGRANPFIAP